MERPDSGLEAIGLSKLYPAHSGGWAGGVRKLSFNLAPGTFFTLLGPSGCGKTTTLRCIAGLEQPDSGSIRLGNRFLYDRKSGANVPLNRRGIGMVFQSYAIWPHMTVFDNVAFPLQASRNARPNATEIRRRVDEALETVDMAELSSRPATQLSGGQQQRVALARAIVARPQLLLLDEPLSNLDARLRDEMREVLKRLQRQLGTTTIYVTHDQSEALDMSDLVAVLNLGYLVQMGPPREIYFRPANTFVASFLGSVNLLEGKISAAVRDGGTAAVALTDGAPLIATFPHGAPAGDVSVSIRPESIRIAPLGADKDGSGNRLTGTVVSSSFLGHLNRHVVRSGERQIQVLAGAESVFAEGSEVSLSFPVENAIGLADEPPANAQNSG